MSRRSREHPFRARKFPEPFGEAGESEGGEPQGDGENEGVVDDFKGFRNFPGTGDLAAPDEDLPGKQGEKEPVDQGGNPVQKCPSGSGNRSDRMFTRMCPFRDWVYPRAEAVATAPRKETNS